MQERDHPLTTESSLTIRRRRKKLSIPYHAAYASAFAQLLAALRHPSHEPKARAVDLRRVISEFSSRADGDFRASHRERLDRHSVHHNYVFPQVPEGSPKCIRGRDA